MQKSCSSKPKVLKFEAGSQWGDVFVDQDPATCYLAVCGSAPGGVRVEPRLEMHFGPLRAQKTGDSLDPCPIM